jgi:hypothetical protein
MKDMTDEEMNQPIVDFFLKNDIDRACWVVDNESIDVKNTFNHYNADKYIGHMYHYDSCDVNKCDLVTCVEEYDGAFFALSERFCFHESMLFVDGVDFLKDKYFDCYFSMIRLPLICSEQTIIKYFLRHLEKFIIRRPDNKKKSAISDFKLAELDVYCFSHITKLDNTTIDSMQRIIDNDDYVLDYFEKNKKIISHSQEYNDLIYIFALKSFRLNDLYLLLNQLSTNLSDIIYDYADFESIIPPVSKIFDCHIDNISSKFDENVSNCDDAVDRSVCWNIAGQVPAY